MSMSRHVLGVENGVELSYLDSGGSGQPIVFLHGLAGSAEEFRATAESFPHCRAIALDQRAHGHSTMRPRNLSRVAFVADVIQLIEALGTRPVILVGQSMGGHTAFLAAAARPDLVNRLVVLEATAGGADEENGGSVARFFQSWPVPFADEAEAQEFLGDTPLTRSWIRDLDSREDGLWPRFDPAMMAAALEGLRQPRWEEWESVSVPTLVVFGEQGMFDESEQAEFADRGAHVTRVDLPGGSHDAHLDAFDDWVRTLRAFVSAPEPR